MRRLLIGVASLLMACVDGAGGSAGEFTPTAPIVPIVPIVPTTKALTIINYLSTSVLISVDGVTQAPVAPGSLAVPTVVELTIPIAATGVTYSLVKRLQPDGTQVVDDFAGESVTLPAGNYVLTVDNVVGALTYFTPTFRSTKTSTERILAFGVDSFSFSYGARCLASVWGNSVTDGQRLGFYRRGQPAYMYLGPNCATGRVWDIWGVVAVGATELRTGEVTLTY